MDAEAWDTRYAASERVWSVGPNQFVAAELADLPPGRAVDLAAGEGRNAIWLASRGWDVTAVDFSDVALDRGRQLATDLTIEWVCADVLTWIPPQTYDLAVLAYLQLVATERRTAVRLAFDSLEIGGTLLVVAHDTTNLAEGTGGPQDAAVLMTAEDVLADLEDARWDPLLARRVERQVTGEDGTSRTAYDALVRLVRRG
ncbi:MAG: class I SAM-dependent methyltransferase [Marmoricola sp.]